LEGVLKQNTTAKIPLKESWNLMGYSGLEDVEGKAGYRSGL
jgi:hypothetical protein